MENETPRELCARIVRLKNKVQSLQDTCFFLESEVLALGNLLIKKGILTQKELDQFTSVVVNQKIAQHEADKKKANYHLLKEEFEEALQRKVKQ